MPRVQGALTRRHDRGALTLRRALLLAALAAPLGGCGFHPLYASQGDVAGPAQAQLAAIEVPVLPERSGQLMRQALQARLDGAGATGVAKKYRLIVAFGIAAEGLAIQPDNSTARVRMIGTGAWTLTQLSPTPVVLTTGSTRSLDGVNPIDNQPFAQDEESEAVTQRLAENLADQIVLQLATYFDKQPAPPKRAENVAPAIGAPGIGVQGIGAPGRSAS